jgi:chromosome segregation ATPase
MQRLTSDSSLTPDAKTRRLQVDNERLRKLVDAEVRARTEAEAARLNLSGVLATHHEDVNGSLQARFGRLDLDRRSAGEKERALHVELDTWRRANESAETERQALLQQRVALEHDVEREIRRRVEVEARLRKAEDLNKAAALDRSDQSQSTRRLRNAEMCVPSSATSARPLRPEQRIGQIARRAADR